MKAVTVGREPSLSVEAPILSVPGALAVRISDVAAYRTAEHAHDWPVLSIFVTGDYRKVADGLERRVRTPCLIFHPSGAVHCNEITEAGLEQIDIMFDPGWVRLPHRLKNGPVRCWSGSIVAQACSRLTRAWRSAGPGEAARLAVLTQEVLAVADQKGSAPEPPWLPAVERRLDEGLRPEVIAAELGLGVTWLQEAYRRAVGEGLADTVRRRRVETAARLLRSTSAPAAEIAAEAGFADQSHMVRVFRRVLARTPGQVRAEASAA